jgi:hypothetical protein
MKTELSVSDRILIQDDITALITKMASAQVYLSEGKLSELFYCFKNISRIANEAADGITRRGLIES